MKLFPAAGRGKDPRSTQRHFQVLFADCFLASALLAYYGSSGGGEDAAQRGTGSSMQNLL
jgi:hypothetical protein